MKTIEIKGSFRTDLGKKSSKQLRKIGNVPCVIYGKEVNIHFHAPEIAFKNLIFTPEAHLVDLNIDGKVHKAVIKDVQYHPVSDKILHADFIQVFDDKPVIINIPIKVSGDSIGVIAGGKLTIKKRNLKVKGLPNNLPEFLHIDITNLKIHDSVKVGDLSYDKIELLDQKKLMVLTIATSRVAQKGETEAVAGAPEAGAETAAAE
ncbi:MAG: 50S ribosomal protein L25/general stress protein Ctc [Bacteroidales bacterium]|nr:50S ribosomal protein L25/general stress protein Ctc [Bacteroidales bacterium]